MSEGLKLTGDVYIPEKLSSETAVVFLHGSLPEGRKLLLYRILCERLARRGYFVFNLDQRGYGQSEDPKQIRSIEDLDFISDARNAVKIFLQRYSNYGLQSAVLVGHSFGGGVSVAAGIRSPYVSKIISISPGRRISHRFYNNHNGLQYVQERKNKDMGLKKKLPIELIKPMLETYNIEQFRGFRFQKPLLVVEGSKEPIEDLTFTKELVGSFSGHFRHIVIDDADHYFGTRKSRKWKFKRWVIENDEVVNRLVNIMDEWIKKEEFVLQSKQI